MRLQERLAHEIKAAMRAKEAPRLSALRMLKAAVDYAQIERRVAQLGDAEFVAVVHKELKKRREAVEQFAQGGRPELVAKEQQEIAVLESFVPPPLPQAELEQLVKATIEELGARSRKDMGAVVKAVQAKAAGRADGKTISAVVGQLLP